MEMKKREVLAEKKKRLQVEMLSTCSQILSIRDGRPAPRGTLPAGKGGSPPAPPNKKIKTAGKLHGKMNARISTSPIEETNDGTILQH